MFRFPPNSDCIGVDYCNTDIKYSCQRSLFYPKENYKQDLYYLLSIRFLYKGIIIKHNKTEPTYTKTSLFLCEKRRFFMARTEKGGNIFKLAGPRGLAFFHLIKKEVSKWPMKK